MKTSSIIGVIVLIVLVLIVGIIWSGTSSTPQNLTYNSTNTTNNISSGTPGTPSTGGPSATAGGLLVLDTANTSSLGMYLVATNGMTVYKYAKDQPGMSNCTGQCATLWPPYTVSSADANRLYGGSNVIGDIGTITRPDGTLQVTYDNVPLYFYSKEQKAGGTAGQNFGGVWFVVNP